MVKGEGTFGKGDWGGGGEGVGKGKSGCPTTRLAPRGSMAPPRTTHSEFGFSILRSFRSIDQSVNRSPLPRPPSSERGAEERGIDVPMYRCTDESMNRCIDPSEPRSLGASEPRDIGTSGRRARGPREARLRPPRKSALNKKKRPFPHNAREEALGRFSGSNRSNSYLVTTYLASRARSMRWSTSMRWALV